MFSHLISSFESGLRSLAPFFHRLNKDAESSLAASLHTEVERRLPGCLLQSDLSPLSLGCTCYVQQSQMALHFLTRSEKWGNGDEFLFSKGVRCRFACAKQCAKVIMFKCFELIKNQLVLHKNINDNTIIASSDLLL